MYFQLKKIILWPRIDAMPRILEFKLGTVNVISGASKTGKSAVIPIVDYCLGADKCAIPVGVIRENCSWFGIVIYTVEGEKLIARREPGDQQSTGDMVLMEAPQIEVPERIHEKNTNVNAVKNTLNRLANLTNLGFEPDTENGFKARPGFRDLMAFTFQPQNIVANPDVMFFKADTTEHREKLKTIFPYVLGAVTAEVLQARFELDRLLRLLRQKEAELRSIESATSAWQLEAQGWLRQAIELGLLPAKLQIPSEWPIIIDLMNQLVANHAQNARPSLEGIDITLIRLEQLRDSETRAASKLTEHRQRMNELRRLKESSDAYGGAMHIQRDRLAISSWMRNLAENKAADPVVTLGHGGREELLKLCDSLETIEVKLRTFPAVSDTLDKETLRQRSAAEETLIQLNAIRAEIVSLERLSEKAKATTDHFDRTERFLGRLEQAIQLYNRADQSSTLREDIARLRAEILHLQTNISEADIRRKLNNALAQVHNFANQYIPQLDAEWPTAPIELIINELTIKVIHGSRSDYLWEIGSGANWLAYHVATTLALQKFFLNEPNHHVPGLLVYDQPSQVYFPKRLAKADDDEAVVLRDQDVQAVRKVFALLGKEALSAGGRLQIVVLDHAGEDVWGGLGGVELQEEWRDGRALVPLEWLIDLQ